MNTRSNEHSLKFADPLPKLVLDGSKYTTWRLFDSTRVFRPGDALSLLHSRTARLFGIAAVVSVAERTFRTLKEVDYEGHEPFADVPTMLDTYARYYRRDVTLDTPLKVVRFEPWLLCSNPGSEETDVMIRREQLA